jgi:hypothetical protein
MESKRAVKGHMRHLKEARTSSVHGPFTKAMPCTPTHASPPRVNHARQGKRRKRKKKNMARASGQPNVRLWFSRLLQEGRGHSEKVEAGVGGREMSAQFKPRALHLHMRPTTPTSLNTTQRPPVHSDQAR